MKSILIPSLLIGSVILAGCQQLPSTTNNQSDTSMKPIASVQKLSPQEFDDQAKNEAAFVLDVHIPEQTHIPGTDAFIPFDKLGENLSQLPEDKDTPLLVYCRSGGMSSEATQELVEMGYTNVSDLVGGINAWREENTSVSISPSTQPLGTVIYGDVPTTEFTLTNNTSEILKVTRVTTSCSCTSAEVVNKELEPYESTLVKVSFNPAVHKDDSDLGELTRIIYIDTDNPDFSQVTSTITANVIKES